MRVTGQPGAVRRRVPPLCLTRRFALRGLRSGAGEVIQAYRDALLVGDPLDPAGRGLEVHVVDGGQARYPVLLGVE